MVLTKAQVTRISSILGLIIGLITVGGFLVSYINSEARKKLVIEQNQAQIQAINQKVDNIISTMTNRLEKIDDNFYKMKITDIEFKAEMKQKITSSDGYLIELKGDVGKIKDEMVNLKIVQHDLAKLEK